MQSNYVPTDFESGSGSDFKAMYSNKQFCWITFESNKLYTWEKDEFIFILDVCKYIDKYKKYAIVTITDSSKIMKLGSGHFFCKNIVVSDFKPISELTIPHHLYTKSVEFNGFLLQFIPITDRTSELCLSAVSQTAMAVQFVPESLFTDNIAIVAISDPNKFVRIHDIPYAFRSKQVCLISAVNNGNRYFSHFPPEIINEDFHTELVHLKERLSHPKTNLQTQSVCATYGKGTGV